MQWKSRGKKRLIYLGLHENLIKFQDKKLTPSMLGHRHPLEQWRMPHLGLPLTWVLEAQANKQTQRASMLQMGIQPEKENKKRRHGGSQISQKLVHLFIFQESFYTLSCTQRSMDNTNSCRVSSPDPYRDQAFYLHTQLYTQVLGDLHHLLTRRPISISWPFSDKGPSTRKLICLKSVVLPKVWCHSQKALIKVMFLHSKDTTIYNKERGVQ